jgi:hypothetical protein
VLWEEPACILLQSCWSVHMCCFPAFKADRNPAGDAYEAVPFKDIFDPSQVPQGAETFDVEFVWATNWMSLISSDSAGLTRIRVRLAGLRMLVRPARA